MHVAVSERARGRNLRPLLFLIPIALALIAVTMAWLALSWHSETSRRRDVEHSLAATHAALGRVRARLSASPSLSAKQGEVLQQTQTVLAQVDPLLADVSQLVDSQASPGALATDAENLANDFLDLGNKLIDAANANGIDINYLNGEIGRVSNEISTVRGEAANAPSTDTGTFSQDADRFRSAVESLQQQLRQLAG